MGRNEEVNGYGFAVLECGSSNGKGVKHRTGSSDSFEDV